MLPTTSSRYFFIAMAILYQKQFPDSLTMSVHIQEVLAYHWLKECFNDGNDGLLLDSGFGPGEGTPSTDWHCMEWTKESYGFRAHGGIFSHPFISVTLDCVVCFGFTYVVSVSQWESDRQSHQSLTDHDKATKVPLTTINTQIMQ